MSVAKIFVGYGAFLGACGWYGAMSHGYAPSVMHSLYAGAEVAVIQGCKSQAPRGVPPRWRSTVVRQSSLGLEVDWFGWWLLDRRDS